MARRIKIINPDDLDQFPQFEQWVQRVTKVELHFIDGTTKEMKLYFPIFTFWSDPGELSNGYLSAMVNHWTKYWLKIKSYKVSLGSVKNTGEEHYGSYYETIEIPLDKIYTYKFPGGIWEDPETIMKREREERLTNLKNNMDAGKHAFSGEPVKSEPSTALGWHN